MVYLDLGCHNGDSVVDFFIGKFGDIDPIGVWCLAFDPLTTYQKDWAKIADHRNVLFINKAVADYSGTIKFSKRTEDVKSSVRQEKNCFNDGEIYDVDCIDISSLILSLGKVVIRMDIEGEEYAVLDKMIKTGAIDSVDYLEVEWHAHKFIDSERPKFETKQQQILDELSKRRIKFKAI